MIQRTLIALVLFFSAAQAQAQTCTPNPERAATILAALEAYAGTLDQLDALGEQLQTLQALENQCAPPPITSAYPTAATTGPVAGTNLVDCPAGNQTSSKNGCRFAGAIVIAANGVTISNSVVVSQPGASYAISDGGSARTGTVLQNVRVSGALDGKCIYMPNAPWTGDKLDVFGCTDAIFGGNVTLTNSYIHDVTTGTGQFGPRHSDGYQTAGGSNVVLRGNNIEVAKSAANSAVFISANPGAVNNMLIENNRLSGGTYIVYCGAQGGPMPTNVKFKGNTFVRNSSAFGVGSVQCQTAAGWEWSGNKFDDGAVVPQP